MPDESGNYILLCSYRKLHKSHTKLDELHTYCLVPNIASGDMNLDLLKDDHFAGCGKITRLQLVEIDTASHWFT